MWLDESTPQHSMSRKQGKIASVANSSAIIVECFVN
jgi:hypothetical protein